jgi:hypothetical protein
MLKMTLSSGMLCCVVSQKMTNVSEALTTIRTCNFIKHKVVLISNLKVLVSSLVIHKHNYNHSIAFPAFIKPKDKAIYETYSRATAATCIHFIL